MLVTRRQIPRHVRLADKSAAARYQCPLSLSVLYQPVSTLCAGRVTATYSAPLLYVLVRTDRVDPLSELTLDLDWRSPRYDIDSQLSAADACVTFSDGGRWLALVTFRRSSKPGVPAVLKFLRLQSCPEIVLKFEIVLKSQSFSTNVLILTIVVHAQWQFNVLLAALLICLLHTWIQFYVLFCLTCSLQLCNIALVIVMAPLMFMTDLWYIKRNDFLTF